MKKKFYITTPLYYPNDKLHIGHAYTTTIADVIARYKRMSNYDVIFLTGSDEHGEKIQKRAEELKIKPKEFVDRIILGFKDLWEKLDISYDVFERTTNPKHKVLVQNIFTNLLEQKKIYKGIYEGYYCSSCETYYPKNQVDKDKCMVCGKDVYNLKEESYFLKVVDETKFLKNQILKKDWLMPKSRADELIKNFVDNDIKDLSLTRTKFNWGISVREKSDSIIYVWMDALLGYLSGIDYFNNKTFWDEAEIVQILGKEITRFHCIYWPLILKYLKIKIPTKFLSHGWIIDESGKMSKSKGNVVDPLMLIKKYSSDGLRFFLISQFKISSDGIYSENKLKESYNTYLVNLYGNLISRSIQMNINSFGNKVVKRKIKFNESDKLNSEIDKAMDEYKNSMDKLDINYATKILINILRLLNKYIDVTEPWKLIDTDKEKLSTILNDLFKGINNITILLSPLIPAGSKLAAKCIGIDTKFNINDLNKDLGGNILIKNNIYNRMK